MIVRVTSGPRAGYEWFLRPGDRLSFGRTERADVIFPEDPILSSKHVEVSLEVNGCVVKDLKSTNGTWFGSERLDSQTLQHGEQFSAGASTFLIQFDPPPGGTNGHGAPARTDRSDAPVVGPGQTPLPMSAPTPTPEPMRERKPNPTPATPPTVATPPARDTGTGAGTGAGTGGRFPVSTGVAAVPAPTFDRSSFGVEVARGASGLWRATQIASKAEPLDFAGIAVWLTTHQPAVVIVDFAKLGFPAPARPAEGPDSNSRLLGNLADDAADAVSPRLLSLTDPAEAEAIFTAAPGNDAVIVLVSHAAVEPLSSHLQTLMRSRPCDPTHRGVLGLCWPGVMRGVLLDGKSKLAREVIEPCEGILVDDEDAPGGWCLIGDDRLSGLLSACQIPAILAKADDAPDTA